MQNEPRVAEHHRQKLNNTYSRRGRENNYPGETVVGSKRDQANDGPTRKKKFNQPIMESAAKELREKREGSTLDVKGTKLRISLGASCTLEGRGSAPVRKELTPKLDVGSTRTELGLGANRSS